MKLKIFCISVKSLRVLEKLPKYIVPFGLGNLKSPNNWLTEINGKNITLELHTNATKFTNANVNRLNKFKNINATFSIDGVRKTYEYIRFPFAFQLLENSMKNFFDNVKNYTVQINYVVSIYNVFDVRNTMVWAKQYPIDDFVITNVFPAKRNIDICHLPITLLYTAIEMLHDVGYRTENFRNDIVQCIEDNKYNDYNMDKWKEIKEEVMQFDKNRNQNYRDYLNSYIIDWLDKI